MSGKAKSHALAALDHSIAEHRKKLKRAVRKARKQRPHGKQLDGLRLSEALPGTIAHDQTRRAAGEHMIDAVLEHLSRTKGSGCRHFLATFAWDEGIIPLDRTDLPPLRPLLHKVYKALMEFGLSGVAVIDFALFDPDDEPPYIHIHVHVNCWTYDLDFRPQAVAKKLSKRRAFRNSRFKSVDIRSRKDAANRFPFKDSPHYAYMFANLDRDQTKPSMAWLSQYLWKPPTTTKRVYKNAKAGQDRLANLDNSHNAPGLHIQAYHLMRQLSIFDCISGVDAGSAIRREWKKEMRQWADHTHSGTVGFSSRNPLYSRKRATKVSRKKRLSTVLVSRLQ